MEVPFYAARERRRKKKREAREHTHGGRARATARACMRARVCTRALHGVCTGRKRTYVCRGNREKDRDGERKGEARETGRDGSCVCTTRRVYQATSVVTAIVPTTSPAGRHPRSIRVCLRLSIAFPPFRSLATSRIPLRFSSFSETLWCLLPRRGRFLLFSAGAFIVSSLVLLSLSLSLASFFFPVGATDVSYVLPGEK